LFRRWKKAIHEYLERTVYKAVKKAVLECIDPDAQRPFVVGSWQTIIMNLVNMPGAIVANLNVGGAQSVGNIDQKIGELRTKDETKAFADAIKDLTEAIAKAPAAEIDDQKRQEALEQVEALAQHATVPKDQRKRGAIRPYIDSLAGICAGAGGLTEVWHAVGPAIRLFFGF
jgi:hypothetical protein